MIESSIGNLDQVVDNGSSLRQFHGVNKLGGTEFLGPGFLVVVGVDSDDSRSVSGDSSLNDSKSNGSKSEDGDSLSLLDVGSLGSGFRRNQISTVDVSEEWAERKERNARSSVTGGKSTP